MTWPAVIRRELAKCTGCGLCLSACPTYLADRAEGDSPRGRIRLLDLALEGRQDDVADRHLSGCLECGACHAGCPTGVGVAVAHEAHRAISRRLDRPQFERIAEQLAETVTADPGAVLTVRSIGDLLDGLGHTGLETARARPGEVLPLYGPLLRRAAPDTVSRTRERLTRAEPSVVQDEALAAGLERASGLLRDMGLFAEHDRALRDVLETLTVRGHTDVTVAVFDRLLLRLREEPSLQQLRVVPAHEVWPVVLPAFPHMPVADSGDLSDLLGEHTPLPARHAAAGAPVLLVADALRTLRALNVAKSEWLTGRQLITWDARTVARFPGSRHVSEFLARSANRTGES